VGEALVDFVCIEVLDHKVSMSHGKAAPVQNLREGLG
jgi:hypothetical protein